MSGIHEQARRGFASPDAYERGRPGYPPDAVARLVAETGVGPGRDVLELGAGTGKLTRSLVAAGARVAALEPVAGMRERLAEALPEVALVDGEAERIGLPADRVDAAIVAQAFHWFRGDEALAEIARVLHADGRLGLVWNARDVSVDWVAALDRIIDPHQGDAPRYASGAWRAAFERTALFTPLRHAAYRHVHELTPEGVADRVASISFIAALPPERLAAVREQVAGLIASHPQTRGCDRIGLPYRTDVYWCERIAPAL